MRILFIFNIYVCLFVITIVASGFALWHVNCRIENSQKINTLTSNLRFEVTQLSSATSDYLLYEEERSVHLWKKKYDEINVSMEKLTRQIQIPACINEITRLYETISWTFNTMISDKINKEDKVQLASQLFALLLDFQNETRYFSRKSEAMINESTRSGRNFVIAMFSLFFILIIFFWIFVRRRILLPLYFHQNAVSKIISGGTNYEYNHPVKDEIGDLSDAFREVYSKFQETLAFSKEILLNSPLPKGVYRSDGQCVLANKALAKMAGTTVDKALAQNFYHMESWKKSGLLDACVAALAEGKQRKHDIRTFSSFGKEVLASSFIFPTILNGEQHLVLQLFDKTDIEHANKKLNSILAEMNVIMDNTGVGITLVKNRIQVKSNKYMAKLFGYTFEELQGCSTRLLYVSNKTYEQIEKKAYPIIQRGERFKTELEMRRKDGSIVWINLFGKAINPDSEEDGSVWVFEDITDNKLNAQKLQESEERYRSLFEDNLVVMLLIDPETGNIKDANKAAVSFYGWNRSRLKKMKITDINALNNNDVKLAMNDAVSQKRNFFEFRHRLASGDIRDVNVYSGRIMLKEQILLYSCIIDVTEAVSNRKELVKAKEAAENADKSKSQFLANMSHEIRTPMNAVIGLSQILLNTELNDLQRDYLKKMYNSSRSLLEIINDILDYSKIEAGKLQMESKVFELTEILDSTSQLFSYTAEEKGLELIFDIDTNIPVLLVGDSLRIKQIINNLLGNAIKFTHQGYVKLEMKCSSSNDNNALTLHISVTDTGIGMTKKQLNQLFTAFNQADISMTRKYGGTGLGLSISKRLVELMGGRIWVESEIDKGSIFNFTLQVGVSEKSISEHTAAYLQGMRTLLVEDQEITRDIIKEILESWNFNVQTAVTGDEGLALALKAFRSQKPFELIMVDWKLPTMDGIELVRAIREEELKKNMFGKHVIVIMVTAFGRQMVIDSARDVQFDAVLDKPIIGSQLYNIIVNLQSYQPEQKSIQQWSLLCKAGEKLQPIYGAKILLVEDNPTNQLVAKEMLKVMGLDVDLANNGVEAVSKSSSNSYDAILMDIQMPDMDGIQATRRIRALPEKDLVPIIAMTAAAMETDKKACHEVGMNDFVSKPIDIDNLATALLRWITPREEIYISGSRGVSHVSHTAFELEGLNLSDAVKRMDNNWNLLNLAMHSFYNDFSSKLTLLDDDIAKKRWKNASRFIHSIKGASRQIGADRLSEICETLEMELASASSDSVIHFRTELVRILKMLEKLPEIKTESKNFPDHGRLKESVQKIFSIIIQSSFVPPYLINETIHKLDGLGQKDLSKKLKRSIDAFDYETVKKILFNISKKFNFILNEEDYNESK